MLHKTIFTIAILMLIGFFHYNFPNALGNSQNFAYLMMYTIILLSYTLSFRRLPFLKPFNLHHLFIWILLSIILVLSYSFKHRIIAELIPSRPTIAENNTINIKASADRHYHIDVKMNGQLINCIIDTGATQISIDKITAAKIGIDVNQLSYINETFTANGNIYSANSEVSLIEIGVMAINDANISVTNSQMNGCLLGISFLNKMSKITIEDETMILIPKA